MWLISLDVHAGIQVHSRMPPARSFVTESQQLCAHILGLLQVTYAGWQLLHQTTPLGLPQRVVGLHTGMPLCYWADRLRRKVATSEALCIQIAAGTSKCGKKFKMTTSFLMQMMTLCGSTAASCTTQIIANQLRV